MNDLSEFLLARISEDEAVAKAAHCEGQRWYSEEETVDRWPEICDCGCPVMYAANRKIEAQHIARWDPARVLAECEAKRGLLEDLAEYDREYRETRTEFAAGRLFMATLAVAQLGLVYADHPDYEDEAWRP